MSRKSKLHHRSAYLLRYAYGLRPLLLYTRHRMPPDAPPGITMTNVRGLEKAGLLKACKQKPFLFEVTEEGELWLQDNPEAGRN